MIEFSVVLPAYNSTRTIRKALDSCLCQSYPPREVIVVDDGSTDGTVEMVRNFTRRATSADTKVSVIVLDTNCGPAAARNAGIERAMGSWVAFLDSDDSWDRCKLEVVARVIEENPKAGLVAHRYRYSEAATRSTDDSTARGGRARRIRFLRLLLGNFMQTSCVALRKTVRARFDLRMKYSEDYALWLTIAAANEVVFLDRDLTTLSRRQLTPGGLSGRRIRMRLGEMMSYLMVARVRTDVILYMPGLIAYSVLRHLYSTVRYVARSRPR